MVAVAVASGGCAATRGARKARARPVKGNCRGVVRMWMGGWPPQGRSSSSSLSPGLPPGATASFSVAAAAAAAAAAACVAGWGSPAWAFGPETIMLTDVRVEVQECKKGQVISTPVKCAQVSAQAVNGGKAPVLNADVFGYVLDADDNPISDTTENIRIAYLDSIPVGTSTVAFELVVPTAQLDLGPIQIQKLKATGFTRPMLPGQGSGKVLGSAQSQDCIEFGYGCEDDLS